MKRPLWIWGLLAGVVALLVLSFALPRGTSNALNLTDFTTALRRGEVADARIGFQNGTVLLSGEPLATVQFVPPPGGHRKNEV